MDAERRQELQELVQSWDISSIHLDYLNQALTHPTFVFENKNKGLAHNQRLEFLGDAVLGLAVGDHLFRQYPCRPEGDLTKMRAAVVCEASLAEQARELELGRYLLLGRGEEMSGGRDRTSILADAFEAVVGAIYLEAGLEIAKKFILNQLESAINNFDPDNYGDFKTMLQELVQKHGEESVVYRVLKESGPEHNKKFVAGVIYKEHLLAQGSGSNKKEAEQKAAREALHSLDSWRRFLDGEHR